MTDPAVPRSSFARRHWGKLLLVAVLLVPIAVLALWSVITLSYTYSTGQRVGYNQKLSRKGWICKTYEGEIALSNVPGQAPEIFRYSVRDEAVARQIQSMEGARVALTYEQHKGVPTSCFGETEYFATAVRRVDEGTVPGAAPTAPAPQATPVTPVTPTPAVPTTVPSASSPRP